MVKNLSTIDRSEKIRLGKNTSDYQPENTIVLNATAEVFPSLTANSFYVAPLRFDFEQRGTSNTIVYNYVTKEIVDIGPGSRVSLEDVLTTGNVTSNTAEFNNTFTGLVTLSNVGIGNANPIHLLDVGNNFYINRGGDVWIGGELFVAGNTSTINTQNLTIKDPIIELARNNPGINDIGVMMTRTVAGSNVGVIFKEDSDELSFGYTASDATQQLITFNSANPIKAKFYGNTYTTGSTHVGRWYMAESQTPTQTITYNASNVSVTSPVTGTLNMTIQSTQLGFDNELEVTVNGTRVAVVNDTSPGPITIAEEVIRGDLIEINDNFGFGFVISNYTIEFINTVFSLTSYDETNTITIYDATKVGILQDIPTHTLDVGSNLYVQDSGTSNVLGVTGNAYVSGDLMIGGRVSLSNTLTVTDNVFVSNNLTVSQNVNVSNTLTVGQNVFVSNNLTVNENVLVSNNLSVTENVIVARDLTVTDNVFVSNNLTISQNAFVAHDLTVTDNVYVSNNLTVSQNVFVSNNLTVNENVLVSNNLSVTENVYVTRDLTVTDNVLVSNNLTVTKDFTVNENAFVTHDLTVTENVLVSNNLTVNENVFVTHDLTVTDNVLVSNNLTITKDIIIHENAFVSNNLTVNENVLISNNLTVTENTLISNNLTVTKDFTVNENAFVTHDLTVTDNVFVSNNVTITKDLVVTENVFVSNNLTITHDLTVTDNVLVSNNITIAKDLTVNENIFVSNNLTVTENALVSNNLTVTKDLTVNENVYVTHDLTVTENALVSNNLTVTKDLTVNENVYVTHDLTVTENVLVSNNLTVTKDLTVNENVYVTHDLTVTENALVSNNLTVTKDLTVNNNAYVTHDLTVTDNVLVSNNLTVTKDLTVNQNAYVTHDLTVTENALVSNNLTVTKDLTVNENAYVTHDLTVTENALVSNNLTVTKDLTVNENAYVTHDLTITGNTNVAGTLNLNNPTTALVTDLNSNVEVKLNQLANVVIGGKALATEDILVYDGSNWTNQLQNHTFLYGKAEEAIDKGDVVYATGTVGNNTFSIRKARSDSRTTMPALGVAYQDLIENGEGLIVTFGRADGMNTDNFQTGETVYVSNVTAGALSNVKPYGATDLIQNIGLVVKGHPNSGIVSVTGVGRSNDIPNAPIETTTSPYVYVNTENNNLRKIVPANLLTKLQTLEQVTNTGNTTSNTIQFTNATTGLVTTANLEVGSNITVLGLTDSTNKYIPMVDTTGQFIQSPVFITPEGKYVISASEAEFLGNITLGGNTTIISSTSVTIEDRIFGVGSNNSATGLDSGFMIEHSHLEGGEIVSYSNIALIHHAVDHRFAVGYTQNTFTDDHIVYYQYPDKNLLIDLQGNVRVQNNITVSEFGTYYGNAHGLSNITLQQVTQYGNVTANTIEFTNAMSFVTTGNVGIANTAPEHTMGIGSNLYIDDSGSNVIHATGNVYATRFIGDGYFLSNIASNLEQIATNGNVTSETLSLLNTDVSLSTTGRVGIANSAPTHELSIASNVYFTDTGSNVMHATGNVYATRFVGDGYFLSNISSNLDQIATNGNVTSETISLLNTGVSLSTTGPVGIINTAPTHTLSIASNVYFDDIGSNVMHATGNVYATRFVGDGYFLSNISSNLDQIATNGNVTSETISLLNTGVSLSTTGPVGIINTAPTHTLSIASNVYFDDIGSNVMHAIGNVYATRFVGDGYFLSNIASNLEQIATNGNVTSQTISIENPTLSLITTGPTGIANSSPAHTLSVGSNVYVSDTGSNVLVVQGNVHASKITLGDVSITPAYTFQQISTTGNTTSHTIEFNNVTTSLVTTSNVGIATSSPSYTLEVNGTAAKTGGGTWLSTSDRRLKDDIQSADLDTCYDTIKNLKLRRFKWRDEVEGITDKNVIGWIAQEVEEVLPKSVSTVSEKYGLTDVKFLNVDQIYAAMFGTIQKLIEDKERLEAQVAELMKK